VTEVWLLIGIVVVIVIGVIGVVMLALSRDVPQDEQMPERWRKENERDRGKQ
jgi:hypothetical protein